MNKMPQSLQNGFIELAALATLADMMPLEDENKIIVEEGLPLLKNSFRPGLQAFFLHEEFKNYKNIKERVSKIISLLNVRDVKDGLPASYRLLTLSSLKDAKVMIDDLLKKNLQRKQKIETTTAEIEEKISKAPEEPIIFEGRSDWELIYLSAAASILCHKYEKPTFILKINHSESQGTARLPKNLDGVKAMTYCSKLLLGYGGHPMACGFRLKNNNTDQFKKCLIDYFKKNK